MAAGRNAWTETRSYLQQLLSTGSLTNDSGYVNWTKPSAFCYYSI